MMPSFCASACFNDLRTGSSFLQTGQVVDRKKTSVLFGAGSPSVSGLPSSVSRSKRGDCSPKVRTLGMVAGPTPSSIQLSLS